MLVLADAEVVKVGLMVTNLVVSVAMGFVLYGLGKKARHMEKTEDRLHELTTKLVDERFRAMTHEVNGHVQGFVLTLDELKLRLKEAEETFDVLARAGHVQELKVIERLEQVKDYIRDQTASRAALREHQKTVDQKFDRIMGQLAELQSQVAVVAERAQ